MSKKSTDDENEVESPRAKEFRERFGIAAAELGARSPSDIESLKFRSLSNLYRYDELLKNLDGIRTKKVGGWHYGTAWKVTDNSGNAIILEEHETGLEILYVVGSVSSIIALVQSIISAFGKHRGHRFFPEELMHELRIERRKFGGGGKLEEDFIPSLEVWIVTHLIEQNDRLIERISSMEKELQELRESIGQVKK